MWAIYVLGSNIHKTRKMHAIRLMELTRPQDLLDPFEIENAIEVRVAQNMLHSARFTFQRLIDVIKWRKQYLNWPNRLQRFMDVWLGLRIPQHHRLEDHMNEMIKNIQIIDDALTLTKERIDMLDEVERIKSKVDFKLCSWLSLPRLSAYISSRQNKLIARRLLFMPSTKSVYQ